jgi:hypothetical protein
MDNKEYRIEPFSLHDILSGIVHFLRCDIHSEGFTIAFDSSYIENKSIRQFASSLSYSVSSVTL